jgi:hypothetical protein
MTPPSFTINPAVSALAAALAVGAVVGLERGWRDRQRLEGGRVAGLQAKFEPVPAAEDQSACRHPRRSRWLAMPDLKQRHQSKPHLRSQAKRVTRVRVQGKVFARRAAKEQQAERKLGKQKQSE